MRTDTTTSLLVQRLLPLTNTQTPSTQETYSIVSATSEYISISNTDDPTEIKLIPIELVVELSQKADISHEDSFELIATLVIKRETSDMSLAIIVKLLDRFSLEESKAILVEYGESESYLKKIIKQTDDYSKLEKQISKANDDFFEDDECYFDNDTEQTEDYTSCEYAHIISKIDSLPLNLSKLYQYIASKTCISEKNKKYRSAKMKDKKNFKKILESTRTVKSRFISRIIL